MIWIALILALQLAALVIGSLVAVVWYDELENGGWK